VSVSRGLIYFALNEIVSNKEGMQFQGLAVVLAKDRWPEFVACERKGFGTGRVCRGERFPRTTKPGFGYEDVMAPEADNMKSHRKASKEPEAFRLAL
jgi:hypothetical protein